MRGVSIVGAGMIRFGKFPSRMIEDMGAEAVIQALRHAGMGHREIQAAFVGNVGQPPNAGQRILDQAGMSGVPVLNHENACSSSSAALRDAYVAVASGEYDRVLVVGAEQMTKKIKGLIPIEDGANLMVDMGMVMPAFFALMARRHMQEYGTTREQLAQVSVKNHRHGALNPYAQYQKEVTLSEVLNSAVIAEPITLLQCTPIGDGAAALVMTTSREARRWTSRPVKVEASVFAAGFSRKEPSVGTIEVCCRAARQTYEIAGIGPEDMDVVELHDCFTAHEILAVEDLGLAPKGEGGRMAVEGTTALGGKIPVNPSGGLLSKGHPLGATGVAQVVELVWQLRGECGKRQVAGAKVALAHNGGGIGPGLELPAMSITILSG
jgi:benzoylsuccinyl-CoA thiolase BbsB subunit